MPSTVARPLTPPPPPPPPPPPLPPHTWSSLIKSANTVAQKCAGLSSHFLSHSLFTRSHFHSFPSPSPSLACSFPLIFSCPSQILFFSLTQTAHFSLFSLRQFCLWPSFCVSIIISLHLVPPLMPSLSYTVPFLPLRPRLLSLVVCLPPLFICLPSLLAPCMFHFTTTSFSPPSCCCLGWWHVEERCYAELNEI